MPLGWLSAIQCNWLRWSKWDLTTDLTSPVFVQQLKCSTSNTVISCIHLRWPGTALSPTNYILLSRRKLIVIYIIVISAKMYLKSKFQRCLYVNFINVMKTCAQGALSREAAWAPVPHQHAASLSDQWCMKLRPGSCNRYIHLMR